VGVEERCDKISECKNTLVVSTTVALVSATKTAERNVAALSTCSLEMPVYCSKSLHREKWNIVLFYGVMPGYILPRNFLMQVFLMASCWQHWPSEPV